MSLASDIISRVVGYTLKGENFTNTTSGLPQSIAVFGEANEANQARLTTDPFDFTTAQEVAEKYGYGSPLHQQALILRPKFSNLLGGVKTTCYPQIKGGGATATVITKGVAVASAVTETTTHTLVINGRRGTPETRYDYVVTKGDLQADVTASIIAVMALALSAPCTAAMATLDVAFTTKWNGLTSAEMQIDFDDNGNAAGIVYSEVSKVNGTVTPDITPSLALFQNEWVTMVTNPYGSSEFDELEAFNGRPDLTAPTGRYAPNVFKPFVAYFGYNGDTKAGVIALTDTTAARKINVTNELCPAPNSKGFTWEAAANVIVTKALVYNDNPHLGGEGLSYPDMPIPVNKDIGDFADYTNRDYMAKRGSSTVMLVNDVYEIQDDFTTYHPDGDTTPKYRSVRALNVNWNIEFAWRIIMVRDIQDKTLVGDNQAVRVTDTISPKQVKQLAYSMFDDLAARGLITDPDFSKENTTIIVNPSNSERLQIDFK